MSTPSDANKSNVPENEIRVSYQTPVLKGVERVEDALKKFDNVTLTGINSGISRVLLITEIIKLKVPNLHQYNLIETIKTEKHEEDNEDKSDDNPRYSTRFKVELHKKKLESVPKGAFYEAPYTEDEVKKISSVKPPERKGRPMTARGGRGFYRGGRGEGRGRGGRGRGEGRGGRGRGEGRPRTGRGEGRGRGRGGEGRPRGGRGEGRGRGGRGEGRPRGGRGEGRGRGGRGGEHREERRGEGRGRGGRGEGRGRGAKKPEGETK
jgi:hypothetical protein